MRAIEQEAVQARISLYQQIESAYRATVDRLIADRDGTGNARDPIAGTHAA